MKQEIIDFFSNFALKHTGIVLGNNKAYLIKSRLEELSKSLGFSGIEELYSNAKFRLTNSLLNQIIDALTTNETFFFRDKVQFDILKRHIIPELMEKNKSTKRLRIWSAACSTGQEPYSIALLIYEFFPELLRWNIEIIASDISNKVLEYAKKGEFSQIEVNRGLPARMLAKYFRQQGNRWVIDQKIKRMVKFIIINLKNNFSHLGKFDIIFCRYVLIYFSNALKKDILNRLHRMLNKGGYLFFGASEIPSNLSPDMIRRNINGAICYQLRPN